MTTATRRGDLQQPGRAQSTAKSRIGSIVALSMAVGLIVAVVLVAAPFIPARENVLTGVVLLGLLQPGRTPNGLILGARFGQLRALDFFCVIHQVPL